MRPFAVSFAFIVTAFALTTPVLAAPPPTPVEYYSSALRAMNGLKVPSNLQYHSTVTFHNVQVGLSNDRSGMMQMSLGLGGEDGSTAWSIIDHTTTPLSQVSLADPKFVSKTTSPLFDPTWDGVHRWLRYGLRGMPADGSSAFALDHDPNATQTVFGASSYDVEDGGARACPNGNPGHLLRLVARSRPDLHPLSAAIVETRTSRFCMLRFSIQGRSGLMGATGFVEVHMKDVGGYWLVSDGFLDVEARLLGLAIKNGRIGFTDTDVQIDDGS